MRNKLLVTLTLAVALMGLAAFADDAPNRWRQSDPRTEADVVRPAVPDARTGVGTGEQVATQLEPGLAAIDEDYRGRMGALKSRLNSAVTSADQDAVQRELMALKHEWQLAFANRQLELARLAADTQAEAEILQAIENLTNPPQRTPQPVRRDPATGAVLEGGAR